MKNSLMSLALGGLGGLLSGVALLSAYFIATASAKGADGGDWLAFAGVFFGVVATISGTLSINWINDRVAHRRTVKALNGLLEIWSLTATDVYANLGLDLISDLRQQQAYIAAVAEELGRDAARERMAAHTFCFHTPAMINRLEKLLVQPRDPTIERSVNHVGDEMRRYADIFRGVITNQSL